MQEFMVTWCNLACLLMTGPKVGLRGRLLLQERIVKYNTTYGTRKFHNHLFFTGDCCVRI